MKKIDSKLDALDRRELMKLLAFGSVASTSLLVGCAHARAPSASEPRTQLDPRQLAPAAPVKELVFIQLTDTHWGYRGANNPEASSVLPRAIAAINDSPLEPDFVVFTGDLTHTTDDDALRRARLREFRAHVAELKVKTRYFVPGEHDAGPDGGEAYREQFGASHGAFDHEGVHFLLLDNVSEAGSVLGEAQLDWLARDLERITSDTPLVVFTHRPLFELLPSWDWTTRDGAAALDLFTRFTSVSVFYGHIHQEHHQRTGRVEHHAGRSLVFPLPAPGSVPKKAPLAWDPASPDHGLGYRSVRERSGAVAAVTEIPFSGVAPRGEPT
jgi:3',5'-cyclic AMP phosphodiesterase CpdA